MLIQNDEEPIELRSGVYRHYKGPLYQVIGYSHNASDDNNIQVLYIGLEISPDKPGPRWATRDWIDFFATVCPQHGGVDAYSNEHGTLALMGMKCAPQEWVERFTYMGPVYYKGFEKE